MFGRIGNQLVTISSLEQKLMLFIASSQCLDMLDNLLLTCFNHFLIILIISFFNMFGTREYTPERITVTALLHVGIAFQCLSDLSQRVDAVKDENLKLKSENQVQNLLNSVLHVADVVLTWSN